MKARRFNVRGLDETGMLDAFRKSIRTHEGINSIKVDIKTETVTVDYDDRVYNQEDVSKIVTDVGLVVTDSIDTGNSSHWTSL